MGSTFLFAGSNGKSGYPYGLWNGNFIFKVTQVSRDTVWINFKLEDWQQMSLPCPEIESEKKFKILVRIYRFALEARGLKAPSGYRNVK
jgi:hypothetical protein